MPSIKPISQNIISVVDTKLLRGAHPSYGDLQQLKTMGVNQVINLRARINPESLLEEFFCKLLGVKYVNYHFSVNGEIKNRVFYEKVVDIINLNDGRSYVHCSYGYHRTGLVVGAYQLFCKKTPVGNVANDMIKNGYCKAYSDFWKRNFLQLFKPKKGIEF